MTEKWYAIVFTQDFEPGRHWDERVSLDDSDRKQHWHTGDLWSVGSVVSSSLPSHLEAIELDHKPDFGVERWDVTSRSFVTTPTA